MGPHTQWTINVVLLPPNIFRSFRYDYICQNNCCMVLTCTLYQQYFLPPGYGSKYPLRPHHRAASCPTPPASCAGALENPAPSPHLLTGGLVGGPEANDSYVDIRTDYVHNEVALDYNAGFQGALSGIIHLQSTNKLPVTNNKCPCKE